MFKFNIYLLVALVFLCFSCRKNDWEKQSGRHSITIENVTDEVIFVGYAETKPNMIVDSRFVFEFADPKVFLHKIEPRSGIQIKSQTIDSGHVITVIGYKESTMNEYTFEEIVDNNIHDFHHTFTYSDLENISFSINLN